MKTLLLAVGLLNFISSSWADKGEDAFTLFSLGNYTRAFQIARSTAPENDFMIPFVLGFMYSGIGVKKEDTSKSKTLLKKAIIQAMPKAESGDVRAQFVVGRGAELVRDRSNIGCYELVGDCAVAQLWISKAAEAGYAPAQVRMAEYCRDPAWGWDSSCRLQWYRKAADQGYADGQFRFGKMYSETSNSVEVQKESFVWLTKAAEQGHVAAQMLVGNYYFTGRSKINVNRDYDKALSFLQKAFKQGGEWYQEGTWDFGKYAKSALVEALYTLGEMTNPKVERYNEENTGLKKNQAVADSWYCKAVALEWDYSDVREKCPAYMKKEADKEKRMEEKKRAREMAVNKTKNTRTFKSYADAQEFFKGALAGDEAWSLETVQGDKFDRLVYVNPQYYKGKNIETLLLIQQVIDKKNLLLKPIIFDANTVKVYYGVINNNFPIYSDFFVDNKPYAVIAEVQGTIQYVDVRGFTRTVPKLFIYAISPYPFK